MSHLLAYKSNIDAIHDRVTATNFPTMLVDCMVPLTHNIAMDNAYL